MDRPLSYRIKARSYELGRHIKYAWPELAGLVLGGLLAWRCS